MLALRELQTRFTDALFDGADAAVQGEIVADGVSVAERIDIYRNNLREGFSKALAIGFPVIEKLVGAEYFRQLALDFLGAHPSRAGNLHHIGAPFPAFLRERFAETEYAYLTDVAALEWACEEALVAPDAAPISADDLREIDQLVSGRIHLIRSPDAHDGIRRLQKCARRMKIEAQAFVARRVDLA